MKINIKKVCAVVDEGRARLPNSVFFFQRGVLFLQILMYAAAEAPEELPQFSLILWTEARLP